MTQELIRLRTSADLDFVLFSKVYNWLKYKTLPPSFLFLNRLLVERDSKHRRITSNLGVTFRNSKWSTYVRTNINVAAKRSYAAVLMQTLLISVVLAVAFSCGDYCVQTVMVRPLYTVLWFLVDADLYLKALLLSSTLCLAQASLRAVYGRLLSKFLAPFVDETSLKEGEGCSFSVPARLHKPIIYSWLTSRPSNSDFQNLFEPQAPDRSGLAGLYRSLFATAYLVHKTDNLPALRKELVSDLGRSGSLMNSALTAHTAKTQLLLAEYELFSISAPSGAAHLNMLSN